MCHNVLCHETPHGPAAVVPQAIRQLLLYYTHDLAGHFSHPYVMDKLRGWYWPQMSAEVLKYCNSCDVCSQANASRPSTRMPLQEFPPATRMGDRLHIDLLSMPRSASGKIGICTAVDAATGFIFATAIENKTSQSVVSILCDLIIPYFGCPKLLVTDLGTETVSYTHLTLPTNREV